MTASEPYVDLRGGKRPFCVRLRSTTGAFVEFHRFHDARAAWAFYEDHR